MGLLGVVVQKNNAARQQPRSLPLDRFMQLYQGVKVPISNDVAPLLRFIRQVFFVNNSLPVPKNGTQDCTLFSLTGASSSVAFPNIDCLFVGGV